MPRPLVPMNDASDVDIGVVPVESGDDLRRFRRAYARSYLRRWHVWCVVAGDGTASVVCACVPALAVSQRDLLFNWLSIFAVCVSVLSAGVYLNARRRATAASRADSIPLCPCRTAAVPEGHTNEGCRSVDERWEEIELHAPVWYGGAPGWRRGAAVLCSSDAVLLAWIGAAVLLCSTQNFQIVAPIGSSAVYSGLLGVWERLLAAGVLGRAWHVNPESLRWPRGQRFLDLPLEGVRVWSHSRALANYIYLVAGSKKQGYRTTVLHTNAHQRLLRYRAM